MRKHFFGPGNALRLSAALLLAALAGGCVKEHPEPYSGGTACLQVVGAALENPAGRPSAAAVPSTRAAEINSTFTFENGDALGLFLRGATYADVDNRKVSYSKPGAEAGTWAIGGDPVLLNDRTAVVSLVHPYTAGATYDNIPFTTGVYSPVKDLLWKQQDVYAAVNKAQVTQMKHALVRVKFVIKCDDPADTAIPDRFTGTGAVTSVSIGDATAGQTVIYQSGKLDLSFTAPASPVTGVTAGSVVDKTAFTLSTTEHTADFLTLPVKALKAGAEELVGLYIRVDGQLLETGLPAAAPADKWEAGKRYTYNVTVKNKGIEVTSSTVDDWTDGTSGGGDVVKPVLPLAVGDYYYSDGTTSAEMITGKTVEGIVFWVDADDLQHFKVVSKAEMQSVVWGSDSVDDGIRDAGGDVDSPARVSGKTNREKLGGWMTNNGKTVDAFPAFKYCDQMGAEWYLPALSELQYLYCACNNAAPVTWAQAANGAPAADGTARAIFNRQLVAPGVDGMAFTSNFYWSSTETYNDKAWNMSFRDGDTEGEFKSNTCYVRCVREITPPPPLPSLQDYYYSDGTTSTELKIDKIAHGIITVEGIIFWVDPDDPMHFKVVAKDEMQKALANSEYDIGTGEYAGIRDGISEGNVDSPARVSGKTNREILNRWMAANGKTVNDFPGFKYCDDLEGGGWYVPALNELQYLCCAYNNVAPVTWADHINGAPVEDQEAQRKFNSRFTTSFVEGRNLDNYYYFSSTEYSDSDNWCVLMGSSYTGISGKDINRFIRCIKDVQ